MLQASCPYVRVTARPALLRRCLFANAVCALVALLLAIGPAYGDQQTGSQPDTIELLPESIIAPTLDALALVNRAVVHRRRGELHEARRSLEEAVRLVESARRGLRREPRASFFSSKQHLYDLFIDALLRLHEREPHAGHAAAALAASEQARERPLLDMVAEAPATLRENADPELLARERSLQARLNAAADGSVVGQGADNPVDLVRQLRAVGREIRASRPPQITIEEPVTLDAPAIQRLLGEDTVLVEYWLGEERSVVWTVSRDAIHAATLAPRAFLEALARRAYRQLRLRTRQQQPEGAIAALSDAVLTPIARRLRGRRLLIVPHGALHAIPFSALLLPGERHGRRMRLLERHEVVYAPSMSAVALLRARSSSATPSGQLVAVVADPVFTPDDPRVKSREHTRPVSSGRPAKGSARAVERAATDLGVMAAGAPIPRLPFSRVEAQGIVDLLPSSASSMAVGFAANLRTIKDAGLDRARIVHFATHALIHPLAVLSGLVLSLVNERGEPQDGFLRLHDIYNLRLPVDLVVLSACQTGVAERSEHHGVVGLTRGFMVAGARRVVASFWKIDDEATAALMKHFYSHLLGPENATAAEALRAAQRALQRDRRWAAPYYWAGFVVHGDWR